MHCIIFPEPQGLLFLTKHTHTTTALPADWGCGKQIRVSTFEKLLFHTVILSSPAGSPSDSAERLNIKPNSRISKLSVACRGFSPYTKKKKRILMTLIY